MKATTNKADFTTSEQIKKIFNAKELAGWIKSHLKMRYRVPFFADGYGVAWIVPNTSGDTLIASGGAFLDALAELQAIHHGHHHVADNQVGYDLVG